MAMGTGLLIGIGSGEVNVIGCPIKMSQCRYNSVVATLVLQFINNFQGKCMSRSPSIIRIITAMNSFVFCS